MMTCSAISRWSVTWLDSTCFQELHLGPRWLNLRTWHICHHGSSVFASTSQTCPRHKRGGFLHQMPSEWDQQHLSANVQLFQRAEATIVREWNKGNREVYHGKTRKGPGQLERKQHHLALLLRVQQAHWNYAQKQVTKTGSKCAHLQVCISQKGSTTY